MGLRALPSETRHAFAGAGDVPCVLLCAGAYARFAVSCPVRYKDGMLPGER
jgi:hypothetical protein